MGPIIVFVVLMAMSFTLNTIKHGEPRGNYHMGLSILGIAIWTALLWWGGFFAPLGW